MRYIRCKLPNAASYAILAELGDAGFDVELIFAWAQDADSIFRRNRWQFIATLPVLSPLLSKPEKSLREGELETVIDSGQPLIDRFSLILDVPREALRRLVGIRPAELGPNWLNHPQALFLTLAQLQIDLRPKSPANWHLLWRLHETFSLNDHPAFLHRIPPISSESPLQPMGRHLLNGLYREGSFPPDLANRLLCFEQYLNALCLAAPPDGKPAEQVGHASLLARLQGRSARRLLADATRWWHWLHHPCRQTPSDTQAAWPALPGLPWHEGTLQVVALCSPKALAEEGERLIHCVATYETFCRLGNSHIVSIRDLAGNSLSTAEFTLMENTVGHISPHCVHHAGAENEPAPESCQKLLAALELRWAQPCFQQDFAELFNRKKTLARAGPRNLDREISASLA